MSENTDFQQFGTVAIHAPQNRTRHIDQVWLVVSRDEAGEGVCASMVDGILMPLITADENRLPWIREQATLMARMTNKTLTLIRLSERTDIEIIAGAGNGGSL